MTDNVFTDDDMANAEDRMRQAAAPDSGAIERIAEAIDREERLIRGGMLPNMAADQHMKSWGEGARFVLGLVLHDSLASVSAGEPLTDEQVEAIYASFEPQSGFEATTVEGKRRIVEPMMAGVTEALRRPLVSGPRYGGFVGATALVHTRDEGPSDMARFMADMELWADVRKFVRWSANVRDDTAEAIAVARTLNKRIDASDDAASAYIDTQLRAAAEPRQSLDGLAEAWEEAEAALPEGHRLSVRQYSSEVIASAIAPGTFGEVTHSHSTGPTAAAALRALAAKLREGTT